MEHKESGRHLAAILFTDIAGYTAMMQRDESLALASVRRHHEVLEHQVPSHEGEIYQYYGDGSLNIFHSAIQAVKAALEIQKELLKEPSVPLRIGIHIGEIYSEGGKIFGDGVNIASRIESIGQAGTVLFSRDVFEKVRNYKSFSIHKVGRFEFKNVEEPVDVFGLSNPEIKTMDVRSIEGKLKEGVARKKSRTPYILAALIPVLIALYIIFRGIVSPASENGSYSIKHSIAVLPFQNFSEGKEEDFLGLGIAEDILTQLARIPDLKVISRSSSMQYKDSDKTIKKIAKELNVSNILDGSIRKYDDKLRVSVRLTDGAEGNVIWADDFDRKFEDVLNIQKDIALTVSQKLKIALAPQVENRFKEKAIVNPEAYIQYQKGQDQLTRTNGTLTDIQNAMAYFEKSIALDSGFARAWVGLADANSEGVFWHRLNPENALQEARFAANRAFQIDSTSGEVMAALGWIEYVERNFTASEKFLRKAIEYSPSYSWVYERLGWILIMRHETDEAIALFNKAIELDPLSTRFKGSVGNALGIMNRYDQGIDITKKYLEDNPKDNYLLWTLGFNYARKGEYQNAIDVLNQRSIGTKTNWILGFSYARNGQQDKALEILNNNLEKRKTEIVPDFMIAVQYCGLGDKEHALEFLKLGLNNIGENFFISNLAKDPLFDCLEGDPEFKKIVEQTQKDFGTPKQRK